MEHNLDRETQQSREAVKKSILCYAILSSFYRFLQSGQKGLSYMKPSHV